MRYILIAVIVFIITLPLLYVFQGSIPRTFFPKQFIISKGKLRNELIPFNGVVISKNGNIIEIQGNDKNSKKLLLTSETKYTEGQAKDLGINEKVSGVGNENKDHLIEVVSIQINPQGRLESTK